MLQKLNRSAILALIVVATTGAAVAAPILTVTDPTPTYMVNNPPRKVTAPVPVLVGGAGGPSADFTSAWNSWNTSVGNTWTITTGGTLSATAKFDVAIYDAYDNGPGLNVGTEIQINYTAGGANDPPRINANGNNTLENNEAAWIQHIVTDQPLPAVPPNTPYLDIAAGPFPAPLYPFQYADSSFYDKPGRSQLPVSWMAEAYLCKIDYTAKRLTIYDGVRWGFTAVPEPTTMAMLGLGAVGLIARRRRRA